MGHLGIPLNRYLFLSGQTNHKRQSFPLITSINVITLPVRSKQREDTGEQLTRPRSQVLLQSRVLRRIARLLSSVFILLLRRKSAHPDPTVPLARKAGASIETKTYLPPFPV